MATISTFEKAFALDFLIRAPQQLLSVEDAVDKSKDEKTSGIDFSVLPNVTRDYLTLRFPEENPERLKLSVFDLNR